MDLLSVTTTDTGPGVVAWLLYAAVIAIVIAGMWRMFEKADQPGWASIIPIYNIYVLLKIAGRPGWWLLLFLVPLVNIFVAALFYQSLAESFGKGTGFAVGLFFLSFVFIPILGFGDATYEGPGAA